MNIDCWGGRWKKIFKTLLSDIYDMTGSNRIRIYIYIYIKY